MQSAGRAGGRLCAGASNRSYVRTSVLRSRQIPSPDFSNYRGRHGGDFADRPGETRRAYRQDGRATRRRLSEKSPLPAGRGRKPAPRVEALNRNPATPFGLRLASRIAAARTHSLDSEIRVISPQTYNCNADDGITSVLERR